MKKSTYISLAGLVAVLQAVVLQSTVFGADKLVVKDAIGTPTFSVAEDGSITTLGDATIGNLLILRRDDFTNFTARAYHDENWRGSFFQAYRARGTYAAPTAVVNGDSVFTFDSMGWDGDESIRMGQVYGKVDGSVSDKNVPFLWGFSTRDRSGLIATRMVIRHDGKVGIGQYNPTHLLELSGGAYSDGVTWDTASSRELKENINSISADDAMAALEKLEPVEYNYKTIKDEKRVGFIAEDVPDIVATNSRKAINGLEITAVLTKVVKEQQKMIEALKGKLAELEKELNK